VDKPLAIAAVALVLGCSTQYTPEPSPRIHVVMVGGMPAYEKNGETHSHGFAGSGLVDAVEDDPEALEAAETYHGRTVGGLIAVIGGLACGIAGVALIASNAGQEPDDQRTAIGGAALVCMLGGSIAGLVLISTAQPYQWDAINIYNDSHWISTSLVSWQTSRVPSRASWAVNSFCLLLTLAKPMPFQSIDSSAVLK
jgi:hypothetical protein